MTNCHEQHFSDGKKNMDYTESDVLLNRKAENARCPFCKAEKSFNYDGAEYLCYACEAEGNKEDLKAHLRVRQDLPKPIPEVIDLGIQRQETLVNVNAYYQETLLESSDAKEFLRRKKIFHIELMKFFQLGYCDRSLGKRLPSSQSKAGREMRDQLVKAGIYSDKGNELFRGALTIPVFDEQGFLSNIYGHKITRHKKKQVQQELYLNDRYEGFWNPSALHSQKLILCLNPLEAVTFWAHGFKNTTSVFGENGWNVKLLDILIESQVKEVILTFPGHESLSEYLMKNRVICYFADIPAKSVNEFVCFSDNPSSELNSLLDSADFLGGGDFQDKDRGNHCSEINYKIEGDDILFSFPERDYRVRGLDTNKSYDVMKVGLRVNRGDFFYTDTLNLLSAKNRSYFVKQASKEINQPETVIKKDIGKILLTLENIQSERISGIAVEKISGYKMSDKEEKLALTFLKDPKLIENIAIDYEKSGLLVGEKDSALTAYLCATSRLLTQPLPLIIQAGSSAGKSSLMSSTMSLMPPEDVEYFTAMSEQSLYYMNKNMKHKIIAIAEDHGLKGLEYSIKMLESEGSLKIASTGKESKNAKFRTETYELEGPVQISFTTTASQLDEELANRSIVLGIREDAGQTKSIHELMRSAETLEGLIKSSKKDDILNIHRNVQRLLNKDIQVVNPYAEQLKFPSHKTRLRRDFKKYLTLIKTIAFLHQFQREMKEVKTAERTLKYIEVIPADIELANNLAEKIFSHCLDELSSQTKNIFAIICELAKNEEREKNFTRAEILKHVPCKATQLSEHLKRLCSLEFLIAHRDRKTILYEVADLKHESTQLGLTSIEDLKLNHESQIRSSSANDSAGHSPAQLSTKKSKSRPKIENKQEVCVKGGKL